MQAETDSTPREPVFGFVLFGGPLSGALVRDVRLANELADRGYRVCVWWVADRMRSSPLRGAIRQRWLFHGLRYAFSGGSGAFESGGRLVTALLHDKNRQRGLQKRPRILDRVMTGITARVCDGVEHDRSLVRRFARELSDSGVTHVLPMLAFLCPWVQAARPLVTHPLRYLVTFQGYELYVSYARAMGRERELYDRLVDVVRASDWPAIAVSADYANRVTEDIGVPAEMLRAIPPGIPCDSDLDRAEAPGIVKAWFPAFRPEAPLVTYLGRRDTEKGIDLLLYAASILRGRGVDLQLAVCGPTLFGDHYGRVCRRLAEDLRCPVMWANHVNDAVRSALFVTSRCIVYPSIHREPFGMVAVEALAHGTPAVVPDYGGIASAIEADGEVGGLRFRTWDTAHLAGQIESLLADDKLHRRLSEAGPRVAAYYSVERLADRVLAHLGVGAKDR